MPSISVGYSLTNKRKTAFFMMTLGYSGRFLTISSFGSKMIKYNRIFFSRTLVRSNIFRLRLFRAFCVEWLTQKNLLTHPISQLPAVRLSLETFFHYLSFV